MCLCFKMIPFFVTAEKGDFKKRTLTITILRIRKKLSEN